MAWVLVVIAGLFETGFALLLKASHGFTRIVPSIFFAVCALISFGLLTLSLRSLPVGPAYAVWTGIGAAGTAIAGILIYDEAATTLKLISIGLVLAGVVGLQLSGSGH
jgi:quaternary ammonium compound-resistance protein SugE